MAYDGEITKAARPLMRVLANGFRVPIQKTVRLPYFSKLGQWALLHADAMHIHWLGTHDDVVSFRVDSLGVRWLRAVAS